MVDQVTGVRPLPRSLRNGSTIVAIGRRRDGSGVVLAINDRGEWVTWRLDAVDERACYLGNYFGGDENRARTSFAERLNQ